MDVCQFSNIASYGLTVIGKDTHKCRYHRKGQRYTSFQMAPGGLCIEAFHSIYPYALGLLYGVEAERFYVRCPKGSVIFLVERKPAKFIPMLKYRIKALIDPFYPGDPRKYQVSIKVFQLEAKCLKGHKEGEEFEFNQDNKNELCPAAFDSIYPFIYAYKSSKKIPKGCSLCCQDHLTNIVFNLEGDNSAAIDPVLCEDKEVRVRIKSADEKCKFAFKKDQEFNFSDIVPEGICASFFHSAYPYIFTLEQGGCFKFNKEKSMIVQCPNSKERFAMNIVTSTEGTSFEFVQCVGNCPQKIEGAKIPGIFSGPFKFCPKLFDAIFPYVNMVGLAGDTVELSCPNHQGNVTVELSSSLPHRK